MKSEIEVDVRGTRDWCDMRTRKKKSSLNDINSVLQEHRQASHKNHATSLLPTTYQPFSNLKSNV